MHETALSVFGHARERVLRHLLALTVIHPERRAPCEITHQELAGAIGSRRV